MTNCWAFHFIVSRAFAFDSMLQLKQENVENKTETLLGVQSDNFTCCMTLASYSPTPPLPHIPQRDFCEQYVTNCCLDGLITFSYGESVGFDWRWAPVGSGMCHFVSSISMLNSCCVYCCCLLQGSAWLHWCVHGSLPLSPAPMWFVLCITPPHPPFSLHRCHRYHPSANIHFSCSLFSVISFGSCTPSPFCPPCIYIPFCCNSILFQTSLFLSVLSSFHHLPLSRLPPPRQWAVALFAGWSQVAAVMNDDGSACFAGLLCVVIW